MGNPKTVFSNLCLFVVLALLIGLVPACGGGASPEQTVSGFAAAAEANDLELAKSFCTENYIENYLADLDDFGEMKNMEGETLDFAVENLMVELEGEDAGVWHKDMDWFVYELKDEGGKWLINDMDVDMSWMEDMFEEMMGGNGDMEMPEDLPDEPEEESGGK